MQNPHAKLASIFLAFVCLAGHARAGNHNFTTGINGAVGCIALDEAQSSGGQPENRRSLKLGKAVTTDRTFEVSYDFYSIPDRMNIIFNGANNVPQTITTGQVNGTGVKKFTIPAGSTPDVQIIMNEGNGVSGTAWTYTPRETSPKIGDPISLVSTPADEPWRITLGGNMRGDRSGIVLDKPAEGTPAASRFYKKTFYFTVPAGTQCLRVSAVGSDPSDDNKQNGTAPASVIISRHCPPTGFTSSKENPGLTNTEWRNTIVKLNDDPAEPLSDTWYVTLFKKPTAANPSDGGVLRVDCLQKGVWKRPNGLAPDNSSFEREFIAVGIEGGTLPTSGRVLLLSHGRVDSPLGNMLDLGNSLYQQWNKRTEYHINWSEGSYWNHRNVKFIPSLEGSRFVVPTATALAPLLKGLTIDFFGHSWGTYIGNELAIKTGGFDRFFALDPANAQTGAGLIGLSYDTRTIIFSSRAKYSMAIYGGGFYGSKTFAGTANDSILLVPPSSSDNGMKHSEPVFVMMGFVNKTAAGSNLTAFALDPSGANASLRPWGTARKYDSTFQVKVQTSGSGTVNRFNYFDKNNVEQSLP